jgi:hypothetical protein
MSSSQLRREPKPAEARKRFKRIRPFIPSGWGEVQETLKSSKGEVGSAKLKIGALRFYKNIPFRRKTGEPVL